MTASPLPSDLRPPSDPSALRRWLIRKEDALADALAADITAVVQRSVRAFEASLPSLTASGNMSVFDDIPFQWSGIVDTRLLPEAEAIYLAGGINVWASAPIASIPTDVARNWAAVVNENARNYLTQRRNFMAGVGENLFQGVLGQVDRALRTGASAEEIKQSLERLGNFSEFRADVIARTEIQNAYANGNWQGSQALGEYGPVEKMWLATQDARTRPDHLGVSGVVLPFSEPFNVGGESMLHPHDPNASAENTIQCRCVLLEFWPGDTRPDGTIVPERDASEASSGFITDQALTPTAPSVDLVGMASSVNTARHSAEFFKTRMTSKWWDDAAQGRDSFTVTDHNDAFLRAIIRDQGFDAKPAVVASQEFDDLAGRGWTITHRGVNAPSDTDLRGYVRNFTSEDDFYVGRGLYGNGVYSTTIRETAEEYARTAGIGIGSTGGTSAAQAGVVIDMAISPVARVIDIDDLRALASKRKSEASQELDAVYRAWPTRQVPHPYTDGATMTERVPLTELLALNPDDAFALRAQSVVNYANIVDNLEDVGKIAAMEGYDAIRVSRPMIYNDQFQLVELPDTYYVIINRGSVAVREVAL
jgi:hypothetical protein